MISTSTRPSPVAHLSRAFSIPLVITLSVVVIILVTLGKPIVDIPGLVDGPAHAVRSIDTQLFDGFDRPNYWYAPWTNSLGNIALFVPLAAGLYARTKSFLIAVGASCAASVGIEITQYVFALGYTDIDDVFFNTIGGVVGAGLMAVIPQREHPGLMRLTAVLLSLLLACMAVLGLRYHL
jgi:glycopeptide antibiotics resistance protein